MRKNYGARYALIAVVILIATAVALFYAGWVADTGQDSTNTVLANASQFASMITASIAILVSAYAIFNESRRADERDETAPEAWTAALRLAQAIYLLDWTFIDMGLDTDPSDTPEGRLRYLDALGELNEALAGARDALVGRALGAMMGPHFYWTEVHQHDNPQDRSHQGLLEPQEGESAYGVPTSVIVARLAVQIAKRVDDEDTSRLPGSTLAELNAIYLAIADMTAQDFRRLWETEHLVGSYVLRDRSKSPNLGTKGDLHYFVRRLRLDWEAQVPGAYDIAVYAPLKTTWWARLRIARMYGYLGDVRFWWRDWWEISYPEVHPAPPEDDSAFTDPLGRKITAASANAYNEKNEQMQELAGSWKAAGKDLDAVRTPRDYRGERIRAMRNAASATNDAGVATYAIAPWVAVLGRTKSSNPDAESE